MEILIGQMVKTVAPVLQEHSDLIRRACRTGMFLLLLLLALPAVVQAQFTSKITIGTITITEFTRSAGAVAIPGTIKGLALTDSGSCALTSLLAGRLAVGGFRSRRLLQIFCKIGDLAPFNWVEGTAAGSVAPVPTGEQE